MISVIKGQFNGMIGTIIQEVQPQIFLIQFCDGTTGIVLENNLQEVLCHD
ncbi:MULTISPECIES: hypothetical protein [Enterococcus]|nr:MULTISPECIES: hypothetical protein [unclassified Enterococcus]MBO0489090.1 hypothetical protein [Enterococcus sp. DIV1094]MBO1298493.1 hypothetical protein [Enterococcus sp. DIV1271a]